MTRAEIRGALERAASDAVDRDFAVQAWGRGRALRRRRQIGVTTGGSLAVAAAAAGALFLGGIGEDSAQPPIDPAGNTVSTDAPTTGDGEQTNELADRSAPSDILADGPFYGDPILVLGPPFEEQASRELTPATTEELSGREWTLLEPGPQAWAVVGPDDGSAVTLGYDGSDWSVRGCGLDMSAPGEVTDGAVTLAGDWTQRAAPAPGAGCKETLWSVAQNWQQLFTEEPLVAQDGDTLVLVYAFTPEWEVEVGMAFEPDPEFSPREQTRDVVKNDLYGFLDEIPASQVPEHDPPVVDISASDTVRWTGGNLAIQFDAPCSGDQLATWLLDTGEEVLLVSIQAGTEYEFCPESAWAQQDFAMALLSSVPTVQMVDGRFIVRGSVPQDMVADVPAVARPTKPRCSAQTLADAPVRTGSAPQAVVATAEGLVNRARACDQESFLEMVETDETMLSFGAPDPAAELDVSEPDYERYAVLVSLLTSGDPVAHPATEDQPAYYEWGGGADGVDWRIGIDSDGTWSYFLAGD